MRHSVYSHADSVMEKDRMDVSIASDAGKSQFPWGSGSGSRKVQLVPLQRGHRSEPLSCDSSASEEGSHPNVFHSC